MTDGFMNKTCNVTRMLIFTLLRRSGSRGLSLTHLITQHMKHSTHNWQHNTHNIVNTCSTRQRSQRQHIYDTCYLFVSQTCKEYYGPAQKSFCLSIYLSACLSIFLTSCWHSEQLCFDNLAEKSFCLLSVFLSVCLSVFWHVVLSFWHPVNILNKFCFDEKAEKLIFFCTSSPPSMDL